MKLIRALSFLCLVFRIGGVAQAEQPYQVSIDWRKAIAVSKLSPSVYVVNSPMMRPNSPIHDPVYRGIKELGVDYLRYMSYYTFPKLSVAELYPPKDGKTYWDFSLLDPLVLDIFDASAAHSVMMTFEAVPTWMFKPNKPLSYSEDPNAFRTMDEPQGTELVDPSGQQVADYYARLFSWYTQGGFTDELGKYHRSGHHFDIPYWEVLNEPDLELRMSPQSYTRLYDRVVTAIHKINPRTKFVGLSMATSTPDALEYFLNRGNHARGIPLDIISYHNYSFSWNPSDGPDQWQYSFFSQADDFVREIDFIENIRKRLSPSTRTAINETGTLLPTFSRDPNPPKIPDSYWNLSGALYAYLYLNISRRNVDALHVSQGLGYPGFFPDLSLFDWATGSPNARYRALQLIKANFVPGDKVIDTEIITPSGIALGAFSNFGDFAAQSYRGQNGVKKLLLINKRNRAISVAIPTMKAGGRVQTVDGATGGSSPRIFDLKDGSLQLSPFSISVVTFP
jgi:hypothetical protein